MDKENSHFVMVHGSCHGAWCWYKVAALLSSNGHRVTAVDLGASGINPKLLNEIPTISGYLQPLMDFMAALPPDEKVILVGHSMGGIAISVAMEKFPNKVVVGVYATAFMPDPEFNLLDLHQQYYTELEFYIDSKFTFSLGPKGPPTSLLFGPIFSSTGLYQLSPPEDLTLALTLLRPFPIYWDETSKREASLSKENYGLVPRAYIVCTNDNVLPEETQRSIIQNYPPDLIKVIDSDHMVMLSKPKELCSSLEEIAQNY